MDAAAIGSILTTVTGTAGAVKSVAEAIRTIKTKVKGNAEAEKAVGEADELVSALQSRVIDLQTHVLGLQQQMAQLQDENVTLRRQIREEQERSVDRNQYVSKNIGGTLVYVRKGEPGTYYCAACFQRSDRFISLHRLDGAFGVFGTHTCPSCDSHFTLRG